MFSSGWSRALPGSKLMAEQRMARGRRGLAMWERSGLRSSLDEVAGFLTLLRGPGTDRDLRASAIVAYLRTKQPCEPTKKGHARMRPRMALVSLAGLHRRGSSADVARLNLNELY